MNGDTEPVTLINAFELPADGVDAFTGRWHQMAERFIEAPGFRDTRLHRALSSDARFPLVNIAHWDSPAAFHAALSTPAIQELMRGTRQAAANPALYRVIASYGGR